MKTLTAVSLLFAAIFCFSGTADAQRRQVKRPVVKATPRPTPKPAAPGFTVRLAVQQVSNQRSNITRFVDLLAPIAAGIESVNRESTTRRLPAKTLEMNEANKKKVIDAIRGLRAGLVTLENDFRSKPELRKYVPQIQGISDLCAQSEDFAFAGKFVDSRRPLVTVAGKLSDTLAVMPKIAGIR